ncbi:extracellular solute-binding protein [Actinoplanes sp. NPDC051851]|uniref:extracellular solute-binding protein n=1 Tax=Actinoplanes sp. NPDC051851 TaxID=3154753 RepID=UPI00342D73C1
MTADGGRPRWLARHPGTWFIIGLLTMGLALKATGVLDEDEPSINTRSELVVLSGADESAGRQRQRLIDEWNSVPGHVKARLESLSTESDDQHSGMVSRAQASNPTVDVYNLDATWTAEFATAGYLYPLDSPDVTGFLPGPLATCQYDGKTWALPFNTDAGLLYYRKQVADRLPRTLPPAPNDIRSMREADPALKAGFATPLSSYEGLSVSALEAIWANGGDVYDEEKDLIVIDQPKAVEALRQLAAAMKSADGLPPSVDPGSTGFQESTTRQAFQSGEVALMRNWPVAYTALWNADPPMRDFGVRALPYASVLGGQNLAVSSGTWDQKAAQELVEFLTSQTSERTLFEKGGLAATRTAVYDELKDTHPYAATLLDALRTARPRPKTAYYALFSNTLQDVVTEALNNDGELPADAVARLTNAVHGRVN